MRRNFIGLSAASLLAALLPAVQFVPVRNYAPGRSYIDRSRVKASRYSGAQLREIRKNGQARECARRLARGCIQ